MQILSSSVFAAALAIVAQDAASRVASPHGVVHRTIAVVHYTERTPRAIEFVGTALMPDARGNGTVEHRSGVNAIGIAFDGVEAAVRVGPEYRTYVLWAVTPEGRAVNLGELALDGSRGRIEVTTDLPAFGLLVTAEAESAATHPRDSVVLENLVTSGQRSSMRVTDVDYVLSLSPRAAITEPERQAVSPEYGQQAQSREGEGAHAAQQMVREVERAAQRAAERDPNEVLEAEAERRMIERQKRDAARVQLGGDAEKAAFRARLRQQLSAVFETRESVRGLLVNLPDALFETDSAKLRVQAEERLARAAYILLAHPGLTLVVASMSDSADELAGDLNLTDRRAISVRQYLVQRGIAPGNIAPRAERSSAATGTAGGDQGGRRLELVISGDLIATSNKMR